jgi:hypothetical protein
LASDRKARPRPIQSTPTSSAPGGDDRNEVKIGVITIIVRLLT